MTAWSHTKVMRGRTLRVIAHDPLDPHEPRLPLPHDFVMGIGGASETLLDITPRAHVGRALDLGCGGGVQALFLNADRIIATDIDERALEAANESCRLSGFRPLEPNVWRNGDSLIEFRQGSLLDPVASDRFDLIVANPPFLIEGTGHVHRDSPMAGDGLTRELLTQLPHHLNSKGRAILLAAWLHPVGGDWRERVEPWLPLDTSAWVAQREVLDIDSYVEVWGDDVGLAPAERLLWRARLDELGAQAVGFGWIVLDNDGVGWRIIEDVSRARRLPSGSDVESQLTAFADVPHAPRLLHDRWNFVDRHWRGSIVLDPFEALLVERLRAGTTLEQAVDEVASAQPVDRDDLLVLGLTCLRRLVEEGFFTAAA